ncbi:MAG: PrgI family protein [bacterium]|nr:PrgI family protein [bacterium]
MKTSIIPAQVTTVEDRIAGNFTLTQLLLLLMPLFISVGIYVLLPAKLHLNGYKVVLILFAPVVCFTLALRIKGKIILHWLFILSAYNLRPHFYIYNKNDSTLRAAILSPNEMRDIIKSSEAEAPDVKQRAEISIENKRKLTRFITNPNTGVRFQFKKGGIHVVTSQISS